IKHNFVDKRRFAGNTQSLLAAPPDAILTLAPVLLAISLKSSRLPGLETVPQTCRAFPGHLPSANRIMPWVWQSTLFQVCQDASSVLNPVLQLGIIRSKLEEILKFACGAVLITLR